MTTDLVDDRGTGRTHRLMSQCLGLLIGGHDGIFISRNVKWDLGLATKILGPRVPDFKVIPSTGVVALYDFRLRIMSYPNIRINEFASLRRGKMFFFCVDHDLILASVIQDMVTAKGWYTL